MFRALGARLTLDWKGVTGAALFEAAAQRAWLWAAQGLKTAPESLLEGEVQEDGLRINALRSVAGNRALCHVTRATTRHLGPVDALAHHRRPRTHRWLRGDRHHRRAGHASPPGPSVAAVTSAGRSAPRPRRTRSDRGIAASAGAPRSAIAGSEQIDWLVQSCLLDSGRRLPVVLFSAIKEAGGRLSRRRRGPGAHRTRAVRARACLHHAARRGFAPPDEAAADALGLRRRGAHLLASSPSHRPSPATSAASAAATQQREWAGDHPSRGRSRCALVSSTRRHRNPARGAMARQRAPAHRIDQQRSRPDPAGHHAARGAAARRRRQRVAGAWRWTRSAIS